MATIDWSIIDSIEEEDDRFTDITPDLFECDNCGFTIDSFPVYHITLPFCKDEVVDFCSTCVNYNLVSFSFSVVNLIEIQTECQLCMELLQNCRAVSVITKSGRISNAMFLCQQCNNQENVTQKILNTSVRLDQHFKAVTRGSLIAMNLTRVLNRRIPHQVRYFLSNEMLTMWTALLEDIITIPSNFGSIRQWTIFYVPFNPICFKWQKKCAVYFLIDCSEETNGRIAVLYSDQTCRAFVYIIYDTFDEFQLSFDTWMKGSRRHEITEASTVELLMMKHNFRYSIKYFLGYFIDLIFNGFTSPSKLQRIRRRSV